MVDSIPNQHIIMAIIVIKPHFILPLLLFTSSALAICDYVVGPDDKDVPGAPPSPPSPGPPDAPPSPGPPDAPPSPPSPGPPTPSPPSPGPPDAPPSPPSPGPPDAPPSPPSPGPPPPSPPSPGPPPPSPPSPGPPDAPPGPTPGPDGPGEAKPIGTDTKDAEPFYKTPAALYAQPKFESDYMGEWIIHNPNVGVNAMQHQLMPNNKAIWYDTTTLGPSTLELGPKGNCPTNPDVNNEPDCFAHGVQYDIETGEVKTVYVQTDPWCSSGHLLPNGDLLSTGGNKMGFKSVRLISLTDPNPKFTERQQALGAQRWYASNVVLEDGSAVVVGGRDSYSFDVVPAFDFQPKVINLPFLQQTTEPAKGPGLPVENNLYPFVFLLPDGNVFIFANDRAISFNPKTGETVKEFPALEGGSRNYPTSGMAALFPLRLSPENNLPIIVEIMVCGGNQHDTFTKTDARYTQNRAFPPANADCARICPFDAKPVWKKEQDMPSPRTMGDMLQLPNGDYLIVNGAKKGSSGWEDAEDANLTPTMYYPDNEMGKRFKELTPTNIARMYHSSSIVLPDGKILVAGSNTHSQYTFQGPYPTELRVEKFTPPYLDPALDVNRPIINAEKTDTKLKYNQTFKVVFTLPSKQTLGLGDIIVTMLYPPFTTHGFSQNQRLLIVGCISASENQITSRAPLSGKVAPPGYYLLFVNHRSVPSKGIWVHLE